MLSGWVCQVPPRSYGSPDAMAARSERTEQHHTCLLPSPVPSREYDNPFSPGYFPPHELLRYGR